MATSLYCYYGINFFLALNCEGAIYSVFIPMYYYSIVCLYHMYGSTLRGLARQSDSLTLGQEVYGQLGILIRKIVSLDCHDLA